MEHVFWLRESRIAGRTGPNRNPWQLKDFSRAGIGAVLSVNDGELVHADDLEMSGIDYRCISLSPNAPPRSGDRETCIEALPRALSFVQESIDRGIAALVHCTSGKDRTGMFLAYYLCQTEQLTPAAAIAEVKQVRPIALSAEGWDEFALEVLEHFHN